jgi:hypothetical protein
MEVVMVFALALLNSALAVTSAIPAQTTLPVVFTSTVSASTAHAGERIDARTTAPVRLADGTAIPKGAHVTGHVVEAAAFRFNPAHYAQQAPGALAIRFDSIDVHGAALPLHVAVRALASPVASWATADVQESDIDPEHTTTQVGGDQVTPFEEAVSSAEGSTVGYQHGGYVYAHLLANGSCDASSTEQSMGIFSASACGLYGMQGSTLETEQSANGPVAVLNSDGHTEIHKNSEALLEEVTQ